MQSDLSQSEREKLLVKRAQIENEIKFLNDTPLSSKTRAAAEGRREDLHNLARKILVIDKKLGRIVT